MRRSHAKLGLQDSAEIMLGGVMMAFPVAVTEEVWVLGTERPLLRVLFIALGSVAAVSWFTYHVYYQSAMATDWREFLSRVAAVYLVTLFACALLLAAVNHFPIWTDTGVALKRMIIVALPASFAATVVDSLG